MDTCSLRKGCQRRHRAYKHWNEFQFRKCCLQASPSKSLQNTHSGQRKPPEREAPPKLCAQRGLCTDSEAREALPPGFTQGIRLSRQLPLSILELHVLGASQVSSVPRDDRLPRGQRAGAQTLRSRQPPPVPLHLWPREPLSLLSPTRKGRVTTTIGTKPNPAAEVGSGGDACSSQKATAHGKHSSQVGKESPESRPLSDPRLGTPPAAGTQRHPHNVPNGPHEQLENTDR